MSKYEPLWEYIKENDLQMITFEKVKEILKFEIDHSFLNYKKELKEYGYEIEKISLKEKTIKIKKI